MIKERLCKLVDVKSISTILLVIVFCYLSITGVVSPEMFMTVFTVIVSFYWGVQSQKKADADAADKS